MGFICISDVPSMKNNVSILLSEYTDICFESPELWNSTLLKHQNHGYLHSML